MLAALTCIELILAVSFATLLDRKFPCRPRASKKSTYSDTSLKRHKIHSRFYGRKPTVIFMAVRDFKYILVELFAKSTERYSSRQGEGQYIRYTLKNAEKQQVDKSSIFLHPTTII